MENNNFKQNLKVSQPELSVEKTQEDSKSVEALYLYMSNSLWDIREFLRDFYKKNSELETSESTKQGPSPAESYYFSLDYELSHAYTDLSEGNLDIESFEKKFHNICSHYQTDPLSIFETSESVTRAKKDPIQNNFDTVVNNIEAKANECWGKMEEEKNKGKEVE